MSTSISLTISEDQDARTSKSFSDIRKPVTSDCHMLKFANLGKDEQFYERRHTGLGIGALHESDSFALGTGKLKRWCEPDVQRESNLELHDDVNDEMKSDDFYLEVDDKMSRNSYEYPEQQAKYIEKWLYATNTPNRSKSFGDDCMQINGNVVGIRGFSSESFISDTKQYRNDYKKLKQEYLKLEENYNQLRIRYAALDRKTVQNPQKKNQDLDTLKAIVIEQGKQLEGIAAASQHNAIAKICDRCNRLSNADKLEDEFEKMKIAKNQFALKFAHQEQEYNALIKGLRKESERFKSLIQERDNEIAGLKKQVQNLSLEPANRKLLALSKENARMKEADDVDKQEYLALKDSYRRLEDKLRALIEDQKNLNNDRHEEIKEVLLELCKLQVYQPKLEMILETETQIKLHLQSQLSAMQEDNGRLCDQIASLNRELNEYKARAISKESSELERMRQELSAWQSKHDRLKQEYADLQEIHRTSKSKSAHQDIRLQADLQVVRESCQQELTRAKAEQQQLQAKITSLEIELGRTSSQLEQSRSEQVRLNREKLLAHQKLEELLIDRPTEQSHLESITSKLKQSEQTISSLQKELSVSILSKKELSARIEMLQNKLEHSKQQYNELKRRFELQQKSFSELKEKKDKELAKLRLDLNLEQYNRQVSMRGIEKELRSSLRELEAMKYRFSKRLSNPNDSISTNIKSPAGPSQSSCCKREAKFDSKPKFLTSEHACTSVMGQSKSEQENFTRPQN